MRSLSDLTLEEKVGQMFVCGFHGKQPSEAIQQLIDKNQIGGVIYFSRNIERPQQVYQLSHDLQNQAKNAIGIPLFVGVDQEGGMVARITDGVTMIPGNMALGAAGDRDHAHQAARISGGELKALGINMNLAPSIDVNNNPDNPVIGVRSFGDDPKKVSEFGAATVQGYRESGICAAVKHFPGHGDTAVDSHFSLPKIPHGQERVQQIELVPFKKAIENGVDMVMTAHVVFPALDSSEKPATLSAAVLDGLLRRELGYDGVVMTDCLEMEAISKGYGTEEAAVMAVEAGADTILISHTEKRQLGAIRELINAVKSGRISEARIDQSVKRILQLKQKRNLAQPLLNWEQARESLQIADNQKFVQEVSEKSMTVIKDNHHQLPLDQAKATCVICPEIQALNAADESFQDEETLTDFLSAYIDDVVERRISANPSEEQIQRISQESEAFDQVVVVSYNASLFKNQITLIRDLLEKRRGYIVIVATRNPFDFLAFPEAPTQIASYENRPMALASAAKVLTGKISAEGKLPVEF